MLVNIDDLIDDLKVYFKTDVGTDIETTLDMFRKQQGYTEVINYIKHYKDKIAYEAKKSKK